jgi:dUTP pyrophosphatase
MKLKLLPVHEFAKEYYSTPENMMSAYNGTSSGFDLIFPENITIPPNELKLIDLGIKAVMFNIDGNEVAWDLRPRSSIYKFKACMPNSPGLIDVGYRGNIKMQVHNLDNSKELELKVGQKLCQVVAGNLQAITVEVVQSIDMDTERGEGGHGSSSFIEKNN